MLSLNGALSAMFPLLASLRSLFYSFSSGLANLCRSEATISSNFFDNYIFNRTEHTLQPCAEFGLGYLISASLIFTTVLALFSVVSLFINMRALHDISLSFQARSARIPYESIRIAITCRLFVILSTSIVLFVYVILGIFSTVSLAPLIVTEYAVVSFSWLCFALVSIFAIENNTYVCFNCF